jgi:hypothetical protein
MKPSGQLTSRELTSSGPEKQTKKESLTTNIDVKRYGDIILISKNHPKEDIIYLDPEPTKLIKILSKRIPPSLFISFSKSQDL